MLVDCLSVECILVLCDVIIIKARIVPPFLPDIQWAQSQIVVQIRTGVHAQTHLIGQRVDQTGWRGVTALIHRVVDALLVSDVFVCSESVHGHSGYMLTVQPCTVDE